MAWSIPNFQQTMTFCSGLDSPYKYYLVVQSDLMHNSIVQILDLHGQ
jgi:hypothetical protein